MPEAQILDRPAVNPEAPQTPPEIVVNFLGKVGLDRINEVQEPMDTLKDMKFDQFERFLTRINGISRAIPIKERKPYKRTTIYRGKKTKELGYQPPATTDKRELLENSFSAAKSLSNSEHAATLLGLTINAIHPKGDGNGRLSRTVYTLLTKGFDKEVLQKALSEETGRREVDINPEKVDLPEDYAKQRVKMSAEKVGFEGNMPVILNGAHDTEILIFQKPGGLNITTELSENEQEILHNIIKDTAGLAVIVEFALSKGMDIFAKTKGTEYGVALDVNELMQSLSKKDVRDIIDRAQQYKKDYIHHIIDIFTNPENSEIADDFVERLRSKAKVAT